MLHIYISQYQNVTMSIFSTNNKERNKKRFIDLLKVARWRNYFVALGVGKTLTLGMVFSLRVSF